MTPSWIPVLLTWDSGVQLLGIAVSVIGSAISCWLAREAWIDARSVRENGQLERLVARSHLRSQIVILVLQLALASVSALVWLLPPIPAYMGPQSRLILSVILIRKISRTGMIVLLAVAATLQARDRRLALELLRGA